MSKSILGLTLNIWPPADVPEHRRQLESTGYQAYCIPIVGLLCIYILRSVPSAWHVLTQVNHGARSNKYSFTKKTYHRLHWILTETPYAEYGPLHLVLLAFGYAASLGYLIIASSIFSDNRPDYLHLTKACGHVAVSQLPLLYLLTVKSPSSPIIAVTGLTHERLNIVHRLVSRVLYAFLCCHVALYLNFFVAVNALAKRLKDLDVITGLTAFSILSTMVTMAQPIVRKTWYHAGFYRTHVLGSVTLIGIIWFHVPYTRIYVAQAALIWIASAISRRGRGSYGWSERATITCRDLDNNAHDLVEVTATLAGAGKQNWIESWVPGMHGYVDRGVIGPKVPFTVVSIGDTKGTKDPLQVKMVVKNLRGPTTALLGDLAKSEKTLHCSIEGPYGEASEYVPPMLAAGGLTGKVLIVAGGVGATYALPIYIALLKNHHSDKNRVGLFWVVKHRSDALWGVERLREAAYPVNVEIVATHADTPDKIGNENAQEQGISGLNFKIGTGRPNLGTEVNRFLGAGNEQVSVMVCGPTSLTQSLRSEVGRHVMKYGTHVDWYEEQFGFGG